MAAKKIILRLSLLSTATSLLIACAPHLTREQCQSINWKRIGISDGSQGKVQRNLEPSIKDCAKFNISVNTHAYHKGWHHGVRQFCQPSVALRLGINGQVYNDICPSDLAGPFNKAWRRGLTRYCIPETGYNLGRSGRPFPNFCSPRQAVEFKNAYDSGYRIYQAIRNIQTEIDDINNQILEAKKQIRHKEHDIKHWMSHTNSAGSTHVSRHTAKEHITQDRLDIRDLNKRIDQLMKHRTFLQHQFNRQNAKD